MKVMKPEIGTIYKFKKKVMKKKAAIIGLLLIFIGSARLVAQDHNKPSKEQRENRKAKMKEMKKSFIKDELQMTAEEEQVFWPIYDNYELKRESLRKEHRSLRKKYKGKSPNELTDEEAEDLISSEMEFRQRRLDLDKAFQEELKGVISIQKVLLLNKAERKFKKKLLDRMKGRRKD